MLANYNIVLLQISLHQQLAQASSPAEADEISRVFCRSTCVTQTIPACTSLNPTVQQGVDQIKRGALLLVNFISCDGI